MKKHLPTIVVIIIFILGLSLFLYPTFSNLYNQHLNKKLIGDYKDAFENIQPEQYERAKKDAQNYNKHLNDQKKLEELGLNYEDTLNVAKNGIMGYIEIPKINVSLVIFHSIEEDVLQNGIGHVETTALPIGGESTHCVLAGHTGLPSAKLLTNLDHLDIGDTFNLHILDEVLQYRIDDISVVEPDEVSRLNVVSGKDLVTLVTCTPYGVNSHRLLVRGERVSNSSNNGSHSANVSNDLLNIDMKYLITFSLIGIVIVFIATRKIIAIVKKKNNEKAVDKSEE